MQATTTLELIYLWNTITLQAGSAKAWISKDFSINFTVVSATEKKKCH